MKEILHRFEIVRRQLDAACYLFINCEYTAALGIGGNAQLLTEELLNATGQESSFDATVSYLYRLHEQRNEDKPKKKAIAKFNNLSRNYMKHFKKGDDDEVEINSILDSWLVVSSAILNYETLTNETTEPMVEFREHTKDFDGSRY